MESINELPDELLVKILASLPMFKETVTTSLISKRWRDLWKLVPDLKFDDKSFESTGEGAAFISFVHASLVLENQTLERLHLKLSRHYFPPHINNLVQAAVDRSVRVVRFDLSRKAVTLPSCLSTCRTLEKLILCEPIIQGVHKSFYLPSLKTLHLLSVTFSGDQSVASLLQICPVLEDLVVHQTKLFYVQVLTLCNTWGTLKSLILRDLCIEVFPHRFYLPSLKTLHIISVKFGANKYFVSLLQICPVLEHLVVDQTNQKFFNINVPALSACETLKTLILRGLGFGVVPERFLLPSLSTLQFFSVKLLGGETVASLLTVCPVLECLIVSETEEDNVMISNIDVPTLRSLSIKSLSNKSLALTRGKHTYVEKSHGFVIKTPSLKYLSVKDTCSNSIKFESMPEVIKADIEVICDQSENFIGSLPSIQHLTLCSLTSKTPYPKDTCFSFLKHLELCTCSAGWADLLACMLSDAPKLRSLKLKSEHNHNYNDPMTLWEEPAVVPKCLSEHLETLEWSKYEGTKQERNVAGYILAHATCLKTAKFSTGSSKRKYQSLRMLGKLKSMGRVSKTCQLTFDNLTLIPKKTCV